MPVHKLFLLLGMSICSVPALANVFGDVRGIVHDPDHRPIPGAEVSLRAADSKWRQTARTDSAGAFDFPVVPVGAYVVTAQFQGFADLGRQVVVTSGSVLNLHLQLSLAAAADRVEASERSELLDTHTAANTSLIGRHEIEETPGGSRTNSLAMITNNVPGAYMTHNQLHIRGGHQVSWMVDGVPVPNTNIASNVGPQFDPKDVDYVEVQRGSYSAEYGDRTYGVFNVVPRTGFERENEGQFIAGYGSFHQTDNQLNFGSHTEKFAYYAGLNGNRSDLGLETPSPALLHDQADGLGGFGTLLFNPDAANQLRLVLSARRDFFQVPNDSAQQAAGIRDTEHESDAFFNLSWVHQAGKGVLLTVSPFYHLNRTQYAGGPHDVPISATDSHGSGYAGAQIALGYVKGRHNAKAGIYGFGQSDSMSLGLTAPDASIPPLRQSQSLTGNLEAVFLEDQFQASSWLTLTGGMRLTHFAGAISENAASPRSGVAIRIPRLNWVLRGFYGRYYQAPPLTTVSGPIVSYARNEGFGFLPLHGERDEERQFGLSVPLRGWVLDADNFLTRARNFFDHSALGNSNIFFPVTIEAARIRGWEFTLRSPRLFHRGQVHFAYSLQRAEGEGTVNGGLTDFAPRPDGRFLLDHDQRHTLNAGVVTDLPFRVWASGNVYYGSGLADDGGPAHLPGHTTLDLMMGREFGKSVTVSLNALNVANRRYLLDNSLTFGGTHYADPRQFFVQVKYRFRL